MCTCSLNFWASLGYNEQAINVRRRFKNLILTDCNFSVIMAHIICARSKRSHWPAYEGRSREGGPWREGGGPLPHLLPVPNRAAHEDCLQQRHRASSCRSWHSKNNSYNSLSSSSPDCVFSLQVFKPFLCPAWFQIASTMSWSLYELSRHPEVQASLRGEVLNVMEGRRIPEAADVARMPLLKATVKEVLR